MTSISIGDAVASLLRDGMPVRFEAYDGSSAGPADAEIRLELTDPRGLAYIMTAPGDLGMVRAYVSGDLRLHGVHPGDPYEAMKLLMDHLRFRKPSAAEAVRLVRGLGLTHLKPPPTPPQEHLPRWRRVVEGVRHSLARDAEAISHHYDVSNTFYRHVLGPSMAYTCAVFPTTDASLEEAQAEKFDLVARKLDLRPGQRLLDVGCGWGGMVIHAAKEYGVRTLGVTLSREQASWAKEAIDEAGVGDLAEVRHSDYRDVLETGFDAISSIGLTEHIGVRNYPAYFGFLRDHLKPEGRLLNHCITRPHNRPSSTGAFIDRYVFPDGELTGSGVIITAAQDVGLEVMHEENLRRHYAMTLREWCHNLVESWDACVAEVGEGTARVWGLYMAGSRLAFERNGIQLHQVLAVNTTADGSDGFPLRPTW
ncbi:class I SAM-dependent methyltransferase [Nocardioides marmotae]|uniref:Methyltransferase domain-containing protein n=1 Tax=Nocardioides marmotae TaxID=2663857 RepID=A0A6I3JGQ9_9ACTN|nr:class I SAM-dependent methyltransferase [Nocardioides marmotae]MCR6033557.1 methyltransferase domain-containing protein [Gordonia jinghuaiqii]MBC9735511.1 class I SAM-dependent methyltransferase [Nocardioides marmotae]MTB86608.1 methyltransferase domain-containing protein [Nocardioides marmotae]MTB97215.1 methyltransferase domain-containing protein [Nocardioides marmotae]QKE02130.1 methyltransferase domain-containing protein [Nocardioides marmotae]